MALTTYTELKAEIADWLNRQNLTAQIPSFIRLLESQVQRQVRTHDMLKRATADLADQFIALPSDFLGVKNVQLNTDPVTRLEYKPIGDLDYARARLSTAQTPKYYAILGNTIEVAPVPDTTYQIEITYYSTIPSLSDSVATNWLLTKHPDIYLFGSLLQAAPYLKDDERVPMWGNALQTSIEDINLEQERVVSDTPLKMTIKPYGSLARR